MTHKINIYLAFLSVFINHFIDVQQKLFHLIICRYVVLVCALEKVKITGSYLVSSLLDSLILHCKLTNQWLSEIVWALTWTKIYWLSLNWLSFHRPYTPYEKILWRYKIYSLLVLAFWRVFPWLGSCPATDEPVPVRRSPRCECPGGVGTPLGCLSALVGWSGLA